MSLEAASLAPSLARGMVSEAYARLTATCNARHQSTETCFRRHTSAKGCRAGVFSCQLVR